MEPIWLFLLIGGPSFGCPYNNSPSGLGSRIGLLIFGNPHIGIQSMWDLFISLQQVEKDKAVRALMSLGCT